MLARIDRFVEKIKKGLFSLIYFIILAQSYFGISNLFGLKFFHMSAKINTKFFETVNLLGFFELPHQILNLSLFLPCVHNGVL